MVLESSGIIYRLQVDYNVSVDFNLGRVDGHAPAAG